MHLLVETLLRKNRIAFNRSELSFQLQSHPSYPSLDAVTTVLDQLKVTNFAARVPRSQETLDQLPDHFIAQLQGAGLHGLFLMEKNTPEMKLYDENGYSKMLSMADYLQAFTGIILAVEQSEQQKRQHPKPLSTVPNGIFMVLLGYIFLTSTSSVTAPTMLLIALIGLIISISIIQQELGVKNKIGDTFCDSTSKITDCQSVLEAPIGHLFGGFKLSDLSMIYFTAFGTAVYLFTVQNLNFNLLHLIGILSLPVTLFSLFYQAFRLKKWCFLCLTIVGVLWVQGGISFGSLTSSWSMDWSPTAIFYLALSFTGSVSLWSYLKPNIEQTEVHKQHKIGYFKFKRNFTIFQLLLKDKAAIVTSIPDAKEIVFGNRKAKAEILVITNPFCGRCKAAYAIINQILSNYSEDVRVIIRFNFSSADMKNDTFLICATLMDIYSSHAEGQNQQAMNEIFHEMEVQEWLEKWSVPNLNHDYYHHQISLQKNWCAENKLNSTPELLINGYPFPREYERDDLLFFINDLLDSSTIKADKQVAVV